MAVSLCNETSDIFYADGLTYSAKFDNYPFADGICKYAFRGVLYGEGALNNSQCVVKVFKPDYATNSIQQWTLEVNASNVAKGYADRFVQNYYQRFGHEIEFLIPKIAMIKAVSGINLPGQIPIVKFGDHVAIERYIPGQYKKFNSNGGWEDGLYPLMTAFCHWTWYDSGTRQMVCDLQGVKSDTDNTFILTDPVIHSSDRMFGLTDYGEAGMSQVLHYHQCNQYCLDLNLNRPMTGAVFNEPCSTIYSVQVMGQGMVMTGPEMIMTRQLTAIINRRLTVINNGWTMMRQATNNIEMMRQRMAINNGEMMMRQARNNVEMMMRLFMDIENGGMMIRQAINNGEMMMMMRQAINNVEMMMRQLMAINNGGMMMRQARNSVEMRRQLMAINNGGMMMRQARNNVEMMTRPLMAINNGGMIMWQARNNVETMTRQLMDINHGGMMIRQAINNVEMMMRQLMAINNGEMMMRQVINSVEMRRQLMAINNIGMMIRQAINNVEMMMGSLRS